jgi:hypothetical protein
MGRNPQPATIGVTSNHTALTNRIYLGIDRSQHSTTVEHAARVRRVVEIAGFVRSPFDRTAPMRSTRRAL